jgi:F-type H+-transporting ATPase subunit b
MEVLSNIGFDWQVALANFINFLIIFYILKKFVFGPIGKVIQKRNSIIQEGVSKAQQSETELLVAQQKASEEIKAAKSQANQIIADAKETGDKSIAYAQGKAEEEASLILDNARKQISKEKIQMEKEVFEKTAGLVVLGIEKILGEDMTTDQYVKVNAKALNFLNNK